MDAYLTKNLIQFGVGLTVGTVTEIGAKYIPYIGKIWKEDKKAVSKQELDNLDSSLEGIYSEDVHKEAGVRIISTGIGMFAGGGLQYLLSGDFGGVSGLLAGLEIGRNIDNYLKRRG